MHWLFLILKKSGPALFGHESGRGKITSLSLRKAVIELINEARSKGADLKACCSVVGIAPNTYRSWVRQGDAEDGRTTRDKFNPANKLTEVEVQAVYDVLYSTRYADKNPHKIVAALADEGKYLCSESTMYRLLKAEKATVRRTQKRKEDRIRVKPNIIARRPGQALNWDITFLPSRVAGLYYKVLVILDMYSRKIVSFRLFDSLEATKEYLKEEFLENGLTIPEWLHGDNGKTLKGQTLASMLRGLGVIQSHSRPRVSNDNPYIESLFGTLKTNLKYPVGGFGSMQEAAEWLEGFVGEYNNEPHSSLLYTTPNERHEGKDKEILERRRVVFEKARQLHPERYSSKIRCTELDEVVTLTPMTSEEIKEYIRNNQVS